MWENAVWRRESAHKARMRVRWAMVRMALGWSFEQPLG
jgi:hypothetical protein